jgi:anti-sigma factor RsiW
MKVDDILLMAYVDGELAPHERHEVEREIGSSAELAERVALFRASTLPYEEAFAHQELPPVPASLTQKIAELARAHTAAPPAAVPLPIQAGPATQPGANDPVVRHDAHLPPSAPVRSRMRFATPWLAVAFVAGVFCCGVVLRFAPGAVTGEGSPSGALTAVAAAHGTSAWVMAAAGYQALYSRDTVAVATDPALSAKTVAEIHQIDGIPVRVPDLRSAGLTFKRIQRLRFHDKPLVQIVYLPEKGGPVALCIVKDAKPDQSLAQQNVENMDVVTWRQSELSYALIGSGGSVDLNALGKRIAERGVDAMFSQTAVPWQPTRG